MSSMGRVPSYTSSPIQADFWIIFLCTKQHLYENFYNFNHSFMKWVIIFYRTLINTWHCQSVFILCNGPNKTSLAICFQFDTHQNHENKPWAQWSVFQVTRQIHLSWYLNKLLTFFPIYSNCLYMQWSMLCSHLSMQLYYTETIPYGKIYMIQT